MAGENTPVRLLQGGSTQEVASSGTVLIASGGSIQVASGGVFSNAGVQTIASGGLINIASGGSINIASGGSIQAPTGVYIGTLNLGGTVGRWAFGTTGFSAGVGTLATGLGTVKSFTCNPILGEASGNGSISSFQIDLSLGNSGSVIFRGVAGTLTPNLGGTMAWQAFGF